MSSSTRARSAAARASLTPPGYNSFSARASSGFATAARYAAADFACCTPFQSSRASSPVQGSFICAASHGGGSASLLVSAKLRELASAPSFRGAEGDEESLFDRAASSAVSEEEGFLASPEMTADAVPFGCEGKASPSGSISRICSSVSANKSCTVLVPLPAIAALVLCWSIPCPKNKNAPTSRSTLVTTSILENEF